MSAPIRVDWVSTALWPGRLGLTFAPGKKGASVLQPGLVHQRDVAQDFQTLADEGVQVIAPLIEPWEFEELGMAGYEQEAANHDIQIVPFPIVDASVPADQEAFAEFIDELMDALLDRKKVVVHCRGGLGRAGLTAACLLVQAGQPAAEAIGLVRKTRPGAIETAEQEKFIRDFEER